MATYPIEKSCEEVKQLGETLVREGKVSSLLSLLNELSDGEGHKAIHFAVSRNHLDTVKWILEIDPECVCILLLVSQF